MTKMQVLELVGRLDPGARLAFRDDGRPQVFLSEAITEAGLNELFREVPEMQVSFERGSPAWEGMVRAIRQARPVGPGYELDDLNEDGTWRLGRRPAGWGAP